MIPKFRVWDKNNEKMLNWKKLDLTKELGEDEITIFEPTGQLHNLCTFMKLCNQQA